jgi:methylmalonyl-CoA mutase N-terminal domain/subunit
METDMFDKQELKEIGKGKKQWHEKAKKWPLRQNEFKTLSGIPVDAVYTPADLEEFEYRRDLGLPGEYPYVRGVHHSGYRGKLWTMRMFAGMGTAEESNIRYKYLLDHGETGLSVAFDYATLMGYDTDMPQALGEFGKCGVAVSSLADMEILFEGIPVDEITTSMTINGPAAVIWAMYIAAAEKRGIPMEKLGGTIQNDILKEYQAQNSYIFPPEPSLRLIVDTFEFGAKHVPLWNAISISGYHIREAGSTAVQELAFTLANGLTYVQAGIDRGMRVDDFAPRLSFFFNVHNDFFEEIAKFRAARRIWAREMKERFAPQEERSLWMRFHTQTAGCALTAQRPLLNVSRVAIQALAAVLGGTQSLHTNSMDEAFATPTEEAAVVALLTQAIVAHETEVTNTIDPLGGSYFVEALTNKVEQGVYEYFAKIDALGGVIPAIDRGFFHREIADASYRYQQEIDNTERIIVGVNKYCAEEPLPIPLLRIDTGGKQRHIDRLNRVRRERDSQAVSEKLDRLSDEAKGHNNLMPFILDAVRAYATLGEVCGVLRTEFGEYRPDIHI